MRLCKMARLVHFCAFLRFVVRFCVLKIFLPKWPAEKRKFTHNRAKMCKKRFYAIPPLVIPPFACHRFSENTKTFPNSSENTLAHFIFEP